MVNLRKIDFDITILKLNFLSKYTMNVPVADNGKYLSVWQKDSDGSLKMKYEIWNTDMNPWQMGEHHGETQKEHEMK